MRQEEIINHIEFKEMLLSVKAYGKLFDDCPYYGTDEEILAYTSKFDGQVEWNECEKISDRRYALETYVTDMINSTVWNCWNNNFKESVSYDDFEEIFGEAYNVSDSEFEELRKEVEEYWK